MLKYFSIILILFAFSACKNKPQQDDKSPIVFDLNNPTHSDILKLSDINVKDVDYIPLETNDASLFNGIHKIIVSGSDIYINDYQTSFLRFGNDGSFKNRFNRQGRGPEEYGDSYDFTIDTISQELYVNSISSKKIYRYTNQGKFLDYFSAPKGTSTIMFADGNILCHRPYLIGNLESYLVMVDKKGNVIEEFPSYKYKTELNSRFGYINEIIWFRFNNNLYIKDIHSDTVFLFNNKQFMPQYVLNHGGKTITPKARSQFNTEDKFLELGAKYTVEIDVWRVGNYIISGFMYDKKFFFYASEINGDKGHFGNLKRGFINDIDGGPNLSYQTIYSYDDNTLLAWIDSYTLIAHLKSDQFKNSTPKYPEKKKELEKLANSLNEDDNPVLMLVKLKE